MSSSQDDQDPGARRTPPGSEQEGDGTLDSDPIEELLLAILEAPEDEQLQALERTCDEHPAEATLLRERWDFLRRLEGGRLAAGSDRFPKRLGSFELLEPLGSGGMGVVYRARDATLNRDVALKLIRPEHLYFPGARARFQREIALIARLQHPGIVPVYSVGEEEGIPYFVMERVDGCPLSDVLQRLADRRPEQLTGADLHRVVIDLTTRRDPAAPEGEGAGAGELFDGSWIAVSLRIAQRVALALAHAHQRETLHRDVKPSNLLVTPSGRVLLVDFGLASSIGMNRLTRTGAMLGSLPYMSPEQVRGTAELDARTDVYSLGVTLYELLTLHCPHWESDGERTRRAILEGRPLPVRSRNPDVPWDVETVCLTAMDRAPHQRYASMAEFAADLQNLLDRRPIRARRPSAPQRAQRWIQRHPTFSTTALVALLLLACGSFVASLAIGRQRDDAIEARQQANLAREQIQARYDEVRRLSDAKLVRDYREEEQTLFPSVPEIIAPMDRWLERCRRLVSREAQHKETLARLRQRSASAADETSSDSSTGAEEVEAWHIELLETLLRDMGQLQGLMAQVERRREFAQQVMERTVLGPRVASLWEEAITDIALGERYGGLEIEPQRGLVPLGPDPVTGLWEFGHVETGEPPERGADGRLTIHAGTGLVFVLLPAATFWMGSQPPRADLPADAPNVDPLTWIGEGPVHEVTLDAFFLSKYEMTQAQWERVTGENPSVYKYGERFIREVIAPTNPVENISRELVIETLRRLGLLLPTESQWEYGSRGNTTGAWYCAQERLADHENLSTPEIEEPMRKTEAWLDGHGWHAPVGSYRANPFGLHDMLGNVYEYVRDRWTLYGRVAPRPGDGLRETPYVENEGMARGGCFHSVSMMSRCALRHMVADGAHQNDAGCRPARAIEN